VIVASLDGPAARPKDVRDLTLMLVGRDLLARASELVSVTAESLTFDDDGTALIMLCRHRTSTEAIPYQIGGGGSCCPRPVADATSGTTFGADFVLLENADTEPHLASGMWSVSALVHTDEEERHPRRVQKEHAVPLSALPKPPL
jgi:hypothetical protein